MVWLTNLSVTGCSVRAGGCRGSDHGICQRFSIVVVTNLLAFQLRVRTPDCAEETAQ